MLLYYFISLFLGHCGYFGCTKCMAEGDYQNGRVCFPEINSKLRTDSNFASRENEEHHLCDSILESIPTQMVTQVPLDYMHLCCLGAIKKLILFWIKGPLNVRLPSKDIDKISELLLSCSYSQPNEFQRRIRGLDCISNWKATELRTFLIYAGPVVLKRVLPNALYEHFQMLSIAIRILRDKHRYLQYGMIAKALLLEFIEKFRYLYGECYISYNIHNLQHLTDCTTIYGPLDSFSAFPFETKLGQIKRLVKSGYRAIEQIANRLEEASHITPTKNRLLLGSKPPYKMTKVIKGTTQYKQIIFGDVTLDNTAKNRWFLTHQNDCVRFETAWICPLSLKPKIIGKKVKSRVDFYTLPILSSYLDVYMSSELSYYHEEFHFNLSDFKCKIFAISIEDGELCFMPMNRIDLKSI